jgi:hypothetical protein
MLIQPGRLHLITDAQAGMIRRTVLHNIGTEHDYNGFGELIRFGAKMVDDEILMVRYQRSRQGHGHRGDRR